MKNYFVILFFLTATLIYAQGNPYADSVVYFHKGIGDYSNQNPPYFPGNVLGEPSESATETVHAVAPEEICSLGLGGEILLEFTDNAIVNGEGVDFTVFENAFLIQFGPRAGEIFAEPGKVAVSKDGINFYEFPFDSLTLEGLAGVTPTNGAADPTNPDSSGGDSFDLSVVGLDTAYYVKITDVTEIIQDTSHPYFDPTANGFDLDAVVAVHSGAVVSVESENEITNSSMKLSVPFPNPAYKSQNQSIAIYNNSNSKIEIKLYDILGKEVEKITTANQKISISINGLSTGVYFILANDGKHVARQKLLILK